MKPDGYLAQHLPGVITCQIIENRNTQYWLFCYTSFICLIGFNSGKPALYMFNVHLLLHVWCYVHICTYIHAYIHIPDCVM